MRPATALIGLGIAAATSAGAQPPSTSQTTSPDQSISTGFVCPVISTDNVLHSPKGGTLAGGDYTIGRPDVRVPTRATNGDGTGDPQGVHSSPGDTDYTAIWSLSTDTC